MMTPQWHIKRYMLALLVLCMTQWAAQPPSAQAGPAAGAPSAAPSLSLTSSHLLDVPGGPDQINQVISPSGALSPYLIMVGGKWSSTLGRKQTFVRLVPKAALGGPPVAEITLSTRMDFVFGAAFTPTYNLLYVTGGAYDGVAVRGRVVALYIQPGPPPALWEGLAVDKLPVHSGHNLISHSVVLRGLHLFVAGSRYMVSGPEADPLAVVGSRFVAVNTESDPLVLVDGYVQVYTLDLTLVAETEVFTAAQGYPCQEELENNSLVVDATHIYVVADGAKWHSAYSAPLGCDPQPPGTVYPSKGEFGLLGRIPYALNGLGATLGPLQTLHLPASVSGEALAKVGDALYVAGFIRLDDPAGTHLGSVRHVITISTAGGGFYPTGYAYAPRVSPTGVGIAGMSYGGIAAQPSPSGGVDIAVSGFTDDALAFPHSRNFDAALWYKSESTGPLASPVPAGFMWDDPPAGYAAMAFGTAFDSTDPDTFYVAGCAGGSGAGYGNTGGECFNLTSTSPSTITSFLNVYRIVR